MTSSSAFVSIADRHVPAQKQLTQKQLTQLKWHVLLARAFFCQ